MRNIMMKKNKKIFSVVLLLLFAFNLCNPTKAAQYAFSGLEQWAVKMVPTLFPFMILNSIMIYTGIDCILSNLLQFFLKPLFPYCSNSGLYVIFIGFLCGFPMGAKAVCDLYQQKKLSYHEANYLLSFCNNISPSFFLGLVIPILQEYGHTNILAFLVGMYGIPAVYGIIYGFGKAKDLHGNVANHKINKTEMTNVSQKQTINVAQLLLRACTENLQAILLLGSYITFVNVFRLFPELLPLSSTAKAIASCLLEITTGIKTVYSLKEISNLWKAYIILTSLSFSGLSCFLQAGSLLSREKLPMANYIKHHFLITLICAIYYYILLFVF